MNLPLEKHVLTDQHGVTRSFAGVYHGQSFRGDEWYTTEDGRVVICADDSEFELIGVTEVPGVLADLAERDPDVAATIIDALGVNLEMSP